MPHKPKKSPKHLPKGKLDNEPEEKARAAQRIAGTAVWLAAEDDLPVVLAMLFDTGRDDEVELGANEQAVWKSDLQTSLKKVRSSIV